MSKGRLEDILEGIPDPQAVKVINNREKAIQWAIENAKAHDIVVIAGKGHETTQIVGTQIIDHDDRYLALEALKDRSDGHIN